MKWISYSISVLIFFLSLELLSWLAKDRLSFETPVQYEFDTWEKLLHDSRFSRMSNIFSDVIENHPELKHYPDRDYSLLFEGDHFENNGESQKSPFYNMYDINPNLNDVYLVRGVESGRIKLRSRYITNKFGYRVTPFTENNPDKKNLVLLGCSYTFGYGVNQEENFASVLAKELPERNIHNLGIPGSSPANLLSRIYNKKSSFFAGINKNAPSDFVFTFIDDHMKRLTGNSEFLVRLKYVFNHEMYFYLDDSDQLKHEKTLSEAPYFSRWILREYGKTNFAQATGIALPIITDYHMKLTAKLFSEIRKEIKRYLPLVGDFYVVAYPGNKAYFSRMKPFLDAEGIKYIDYSEVDISGLLNGHENLLIDYHPSPLAHDLYGRMLSHDLKENFN